MPAVFLHNLLYSRGRPPSSGLRHFLALRTLPSARPRERRSGNGPGATAFGAAARLLLYMPYTYSGAGGSIGNRYFMSFYPLFLFLTPPLSSPRAPLAAIVGGSLFTAQMVLTPFHTAFFPSDHARSGPLRMLPVERTLVNDLMVTGDERRARVPLGCPPPAYFWMPTPSIPKAPRSGRAGRVPCAPAGGRCRQHRAAAHCRPERRGLERRRRIRHDQHRRRPDRPADGSRRGRDCRLSLAMVPYQALSQPTNWMYVCGRATTAGFIPLLEVPAPRTAASWRHDHHQAVWQ